MKYFTHQSLSRLIQQLVGLKANVHHDHFLTITRQRILITSITLCCAFMAIIVRLTDVMLFQTRKHSSEVLEEIHENNLPRSDIYDRNGQVIATHLVTASVYANPKVVINPQKAAQKLHSLFPELSLNLLHKRLISNKNFVWITRHISPKLQNAVNQLGIPGVYLQKDYKRVYPFGNLLSHILGYCSLDNSGLAGIEQYFDRFLKGKTQEALRLSLDIRIQHIVHDVLSDAVSEFKAVGGNAIVMDLKTGEILAMVSLPDFDPHQISDVSSMTLFNRNTLGSNEPGSTFKILNTAIALETGFATPKSAYDATTPIKLGRFKITDFKAKNRVLSLTEAFVYSSNIAAVKMAQQFGIANQKYYFKKFGVFDTAKIELPEISAPLLPKDWREPTLMTAAYGYGISVTPLQILSIISGIIHDGKSIRPTLICRKDIENTTKTSENTPVVSLKTSRTIREMMRMAVLYGGSRKADIKGYEVFAKTGTAYQNKGKSGYNGQDRTTSCIGGFPFSDPKIMIIVMLDSPQATKDTFNYRAAGWNAAPTLGRMIERIAPVLGIMPSNQEPPMRYVRWYDPDLSAKIFSTQHQGTHP